MARVLLGVTGGIAAYRALELARLATKAGHGVRVVMTQSATRFVGAASFEGIVGAPVLISEWDRDEMRGAWPGEAMPEHEPIGHLALAERCDVFLVAPASANTIAKLAAGTADSMLTTSFLACDAPRLVAPAMNDRMYRDAATQTKPRAPARARGRGDRARRGRPRLARRARHRAAASARGAARADRRGTAGPARALGWAQRTRYGRRNTRADRFRALHRQPLQRAHGRGAGRGRAQPRRRASPWSRPTCRCRSRPGSRSSRSRQRPSLPRRPATAFASADVLLMAAAVADFRPERADGKLAREGSGGIELRLTETEDVVASLASERNPIRRWSASPPSTARRRSRAHAKSSSARASTRSSSTTSRGPRSASIQSATRSRSSPARVSAPCRRARRARSPKRSSTRSRILRGVRTL